MSTRTRVAVVLGVVSAIMLGSAGAVQAARLPSRTEAQIFVKAFRQGARDRQTVVTGVRVSTVDPRWAVVRYTVLPSGARPPKGLAIAARRSSARSEYEHRSGRSARRGSPPKKVEDDLRKPLHVYLVFDVKNGVESGTRKASGTDPCGAGPEPWSYTVGESVKLNWHLEYSVPDYANVYQGGLFAQTPAAGGGWFSAMFLSLAHSSMSIQDTVSIATHDSSCGKHAPKSQSCTYNYSLPKSPDSFWPVDGRLQFFVGVRGIELPSVQADQKNSCPADYAQIPQAGFHRWQGETGAFAPIHLIPSTSSFGEGLGTPQYVTNLDRVRSLLSVHRPETVDCSDAGSKCTDSLNWHGTVTFAIRP